MKTKALLSSITILLILLNSACQKPQPIAGFIVSKTEASPGDLIQFTNKSLDATSYTWDFGDGATSIDMNPSHTYSELGSYSVKLKASNENGEDIATRTITISHPEPVASFTMNKTEAETGETISFTNTSQHATSYSWDFGDGNSSIDENPLHAYTGDGNFTIVLTAKGDGGENSTSKTVVITQPPLKGKWIISSGTYNGGGISNLSGYFEIIDDDDYKAKFDDGIDDGYVEAKYSISNGVFDSNMNDYNFALNGMSMVSPNGYYSSISCSRTTFNNWGATAIGVDEPKIKIQDGKLVLTSSNGKAVIQYTRD